MGSQKYDEIGYWSEVKLDIIKDYAKQYSTILTAHRNPPLYHVYIDGFAGSGYHHSKRTGEMVQGSPLNALEVRPSFKEFHFVDLDKKKFQALEDLAKEQENVHVYYGDCNNILLKKIFPQVRFENYKRALCLLDPYGLHLNWDVIETAGHMKSIEIFLNFPVMDMNMNVLKKNLNTVDDNQAKRMDQFWGNHSWFDAAYRKMRTLFDDEELLKNGNESLAEAFRSRLKDVAGFKHVPEPIPMRNSNGAIIYYLYFASQRPVARDIVSYIFKKYKNRGAGYGY